MTVFQGKGEKKVIRRFTLKLIIVYTLLKSSNSFFVLCGGLLWEICTSIKMYAIHMSPTVLSVQDMLDFPVVSYL